MTREELQTQVLNTDAKYLCLELATGTGKSKIALEWIDKYNPKKILIVVPRIILINNFKKEILKWNKQHLLERCVYTTYISLLKYDLSTFDIILFDEAHHLTSRCLEYIKQYNINRAILLSATIIKSKKENLKLVFGNIIYFKVDTSTAINNEILPKPKIYLWPLLLDSINHNENIIVKKGSSSRQIRCYYEDRFTYISRYPSCTIIAKCTQKQKYAELCARVNYWKDRYYNDRIEKYKRNWLRASLIRLQWLSNIKVNHIKSLINILYKDRYIIFCNSIKQAKTLNSNCISSENKKTEDILDKFNAGKITSISCVNMLNEGCNLTNCRIGIWAVINSSLIMQCQKLGRNLRHPNPIIIIPYYKNTREEDIINKFVSNFDSKLITKINNATNIQL